MKVQISTLMSVELVQGDITQEETDAIVCAAHPELQHAEGVSKAIFEAAGSDLERDCARYLKNRGPLSPGQVMATTGGRLSTSHVIHTVGPIWQGGGAGEADVLAQCYRGAIRLADEMALGSLAVSAISTGAFGYPVDQAAEIALISVYKNLKKCRNLLLVRFVLFDSSTLETFSAVARELIEREGKIFL